VNGAGATFTKVLPGGSLEVLVHTVLIKPTTGNASLIVSLLGLGSERYRSGGGLESESLRRRFWAHYLMNCHAAESGMGDEPSEKTLKLPLPWREEDFEAGTTSAPPVTLECGFNNGSLYAEVVRSLTLWRVYHLRILSYANEIPGTKCLL
jgi:hypothetical protein